jgi:hypothetical protein
MARWEYRTLQIDQSFWLGKVDKQKLTNELNKLGAQGWELVTTIETNIGHGTTNEIVLFLKRPAG